MEGKPIRALVFRNGKLIMEERPCPEPAKNEVLVKVNLAGICNTDLEIMKGYLGFEGIPGHEFVGRVVKDPLQEISGKRVVGSINIPCGECIICQKGLLNHCLQMRVLGIRGKDGAFAEYLTLPRENLYLLPEGITDEEAVFIEPLAAALEIPEKIHLKPTSEIVILGDGKLGLLTAQSLWAMGYKLALIGRHPEKLKLLESLDIDTYPEGEYQGLADVVIECTGNETGITQALQLVRPEGVVVVKTTINGQPAIDLSKVAVNELKLIGSRCGPFLPAIRLLKRNKLPLARMVDSIFRFDQGIEAMKRAGEKGVLKVLLKIG